MIQWLARNRMSKNPVVSQVTRLLVSVFNICWNFKEVASYPSEGKDLLARQKEAGKNKKLPCSSSLYRLSAEGGVQIRSGLKD